MNYFEFKKRLEEGKFIFNHRGHNRDASGFDIEVQKERMDYAVGGIIRSIEFMLNYKLSEEDAKDPEKVKTHEQMLATEKRICSSDSWATPGKAIETFGSGGEYTCFNCGQRLVVGLLDEHTITLFHNRIHPDTEYVGKTGYQFKRMSKRLSRLCKYHKGLVPLTHTIEIPTGKLILANHFGEFVEIPEHLAYTDEWSLNFFAGRERREKHLAKTQNIAYGQLGNTSFDVYANKARTHIILASSWSYGKGGRPSGFRRIGNVDCAVWAWYGADMVNLPKEYDHTKTDNKVILDVTPGKWCFRTDYQYLPESPDGVYAELYLKETK